MPIPALAPDLTEAPTLAHATKQYTWTSFHKYDLPNHDVTSMPANDIEVVKNFVVDHGYSGFCVWAGTAYIKKADHQLTSDDLQSLGFLSTVVFYIPVPVEDPIEVFDEALKATSTTTIATAPPAWTTSTTTTSAPRRQCLYGHDCYNRNPQHKRDFSHPGDADWHGAGRDTSAQTTTVTTQFVHMPRRQCMFGHECYNKNPQHKRDFSHPGDADWQGAGQADIAKATTPAQTKAPTPALATVPTQPEWVVGQKIEVQSGNGSWTRCEASV
jgi:hypothetical protein